VSELPACTLGPAALSDRIEEIRAIGSDSLVAAVSESELHFRADDRTRERLGRLVAAERACCEGIRMELRERGDHLALTVSGPGSQAFHTAFTGG
jgi:hypothetical protein